MHRLRSKASQRLWSWSTKSEDACVHPDSDMPSMPSEPCICTCQLISGRRIVGHISPEF